MTRALVYVDGFNLYHGLRDKGWRRYYWLDARRLAERLLLPDQTLVAVRYFTARVSAEPGNPDKPRRQSAYLEALATLPDLSIHYGYFMARERRCPACGAVRRSHEEKMTDVNIAVEMLGDATDDAFDTAILVSADSDLVGPVRAVRERYGKRVVVAFPPARFSNALRDAASRATSIERKMRGDAQLLQASQLPDRVRVADGRIVERPDRWR